MKRSGPGRASAASRATAAYRQQALLAGRHLVAVLVQHGGLDARQRPRGRARASPGMSPGSGEIMISPVSVCHQVSTIGQRSPPITFQYQSHAFGLIGSPTVPEQPQLRQVVLLGCSTPHFMHARIAVGAV